MNNFFSAGKINESLGLESVTHEEEEEAAKHFQLIPSDLRFLLPLFLVKVCLLSNSFVAAHRNRKFFHLDMSGWTRLT